MESLRPRRAAKRPLLLGLATIVTVLGLALTAAPASAGNGYSVSGTVFFDSDGDGVLDPGEAGIAGVTVQFDSGSDGTVDDTTLTDASGNYSSPLLNASSVRVRAIAPAGMVQTSANPPDFTVQASGVNFGFGLASVTSVPTLDAWGIGTLILLCAALAVRHLHRAATARRST